MPWPSSVSALLIAAATDAVPLAPLRAQSEAEGRLGLDLHRRRGKTPTDR